MMVKQKPVEEALWSEEYLGQPIELKNSPIWLEIEEQSKHISFLIHPCKWRASVRPECVMSYSSNNLTVY